MPNLGYRHRSRKRRLLYTVAPLSMRVFTMTDPNESISDSGDVFPLFGEVRGVFLLQPYDSRRELRRMSDISRDRDYLVYTVEYFSVFIVVR